jgi:hypothetical protein
MADRRSDEQFTGEDDDTMDPRDFLKKTQRFIMAMTWEDEEKVEYFETWLKSGSAAEQWFGNLKAAKKATWKELCNAFKEQWPERPIVQKTTAEKQAELEGERITEAELGTKVKANGTETYAHVAWANKIEKLAKAIPDNNNLLVVGCRRQLPPTLKALVNSSHDTWTTFCAAVRAIKPLDIEEEKEKQAKQARLEGELQRVRQQQQRQPPTTPSSALGQAFPNFSVGPIPQPSFQPISTSAQGPNQPYRGPQRMDTEKLAIIGRIPPPQLQGEQHTKQRSQHGTAPTMGGLHTKRDHTRSRQERALSQVGNVSLVDIQDTHQQRARRTRGYRRQREHGDRKLTPSGLVRMRPPEPVHLMSTLWHRRTSLRQGRIMMLQSSRNTLQDRTRETRKGHPETRHQTNGPAARWQDGSICPRA